MLVGQGADGDYNGDSSALYQSKDNGDMGICRRSEKEIIRMFLKNKITTELYISFRSLVRGIIPAMKIKCTYTSAAFLCFISYAYYQLYIERYFGDIQKWIRNITCCFALFVVVLVALRIGYF